MRPFAYSLILLFAVLLLTGSGCARTVGDPGLAKARSEHNALDPEITRLMRAAHVPGLAVAVICDGKISYLEAYGARDVGAKLPLHVNTVMYGASLTKATFAYMVMTLVDDGTIDLDKPVAAYLPKPLPDYPDYADLAGDPRWRTITPRMLLSHTSGFPNWRFYTAHGVDENGKLFINQQPGTRYGYSGEGMQLLQFMIETGLGMDVGELMQARVFNRFGMIRTSMTGARISPATTPLVTTKTARVSCTTGRTMSARPARWTRPWSTTPASCRGW